MNNTVTITLNNLSETQFLLDVLDEAARDCAAESTNEHLWALGSNTNDEAILHEWTSGEARKNREILLRVSKEIKEQTVEIIKGCAKEQK